MLDSEFRTQELYQCEERINSSLEEKIRINMQSFAYSPNLSDQIIAKAVTNFPTEDI
jgi:hypothetical protein